MLWFLSDPLDLPPPRPPFDPICSQPSLRTHTEMGSQQSDDRGNNAAHGALEKERNNPALPFCTRADLRRHRTAADCWMAIHGLVFNVTDLLRSHPGAFASAVNIESSTSLLLASSLIPLFALLIVPAVLRRRGFAPGFCRQGCIRGVR